MREVVVRKGLTVDNTPPTTIAAYIAAAPEAVRPQLIAMYNTIRATAPDAQEKISYQMPTFTLAGQNLVHFAVYKNHIGFYPASSGIAAFHNELTAYKNSKGAVQFPLGQPLPLNLVARIVQFRVDEILKTISLKPHKR